METREVEIVYHNGNILEMRPLGHVRGKKETEENGFTFKKQTLEIDDDGLTEVDKKGFVVSGNRLMTVAQKLEEITREEAEVNEKIANDQRLRNKLNVSGKPNKWR